jgi:endonuclease/exonuclease/phosphatase family metal-dependent hydrolase
VSFRNENLIDVPEGYYYKPSIALDTKRQTYREKWEKFREAGGWSQDDYLALGTGILWRKDLTHCAIWDFDNAQAGNDIQNEEVHLDTGLYTGDRDTEPRLAVVAHFVLNSNETPLDIFIVNLHLTTLKGEREGILERDDLGSRIRLAQIDIILNGIVSRYNQWRKQKNITRVPALWFLAGDFNCTENSPEIAKIQRMNFLDIVPNKGSGTKGSGVPTTKATIVVDYIFAGSTYTTFNPNSVKDVISNNLVLHNITGSDHFPLYGKLEIKFD